MLKSRYNTDIIDAWTDSTVPEIIGTISDDLCLYQLLISNPKFAQAFQPIYNNARQQLQDIRDGNLDIYEVSRYTDHIDDAIDTGTMDSDFDPERDYDDMTVNPFWILPDARELDNYNT